MKEYWELFRTDPAYAGKAEAFSRKVRDISELLAGVPLCGQLQPLDLTVTYHDACHLAHGQKIRQEPRRPLKTIPGLRSYRGGTVGQAFVACKANNAAMHSGCLS